MSRHAEVGLKIWCGAFRLLCDDSEQEAHEDLDRVRMELQELRETHAAEREAQLQNAETLRQQIAEMHKENMDAILAEDVSEQAKGMLDDLAREGGDVEAKIAAMRETEKEKLRARLEAR